MDSQTQVPPTRLIGNNRIGYVVLCGLSVIGAFALSAVFGALLDPFVLMLLGGIVLFGLFNLAGAFRPKWLELSPETLRYRPVIGSERVVPLVAIQSFDYVFVSQGTGVLTYRDHDGRTHGLGLWLDIWTLLREVEDWRVRHT